MREATASRLSSGETATSETPPLPNRARAPGGKQRVMLGVTVGQSASGSHSLPPFDAHLPQSEAAPDKTTGVGKPSLDGSLRPPQLCRNLSDGQTFEIE